MLLKVIGFLSGKHAIPPRMPSEWGGGGHPPAAPRRTRVLLTARPSAPPRETSLPGHACRNRVKRGGSTQKATRYRVVRARYRNMQWSRGGLVFEAHRLRAGRWRSSASSASANARLADGASFRASARNVPAGWFVREESSEAAIEQIWNKQASQGQSLALA